MIHNTETFFKDFDQLFQSKHNLLYVITWEEKRFLEHFEEKYPAQDAFFWSSASGFCNKKKKPLSEATKDPLHALSMIHTLPEDSILFFLDFHHALKDENIVRCLREAITSNAIQNRKVVIVSPHLEIPIELQKEVYVVDFPLPDFSELNRLLFEILSKPPYKQRTKLNMSNAEKDLLVDAVRGLTLQEAKRAFKKALVHDWELNAQDIELVLQQKIQAIRKSGFLEYFQTQNTLDDLGGLENLKTWLTERSTAFSEKAKQFGLPSPKGILLMGVQGCGKSLAAKVISQIYHMPLIRFDLGKVFSSFIGSSESNMRIAIQTAEAVAPCILWVDEIEKAVSGMNGKLNNDGGTTSRVFSTFLTWLQERTSPVFVVATANQIESLPPELIRKGRLDEIFFIDLPNEAERKIILSIHLQKRNRNPTDFDVDTIAKECKGFSGAEIEQVIVSALHRAFFENRDLQNEDLSRAITDTYPLSITMQEEIHKLKEWASKRARPAS